MAIISELDKKVKIFVINSEKLGKFASIDVRPFDKKRTSIEFNFQYDENGNELSQIMFAWKYKKDSASHISQFF